MPVAYPTVNQPSAREDWTFSPWFMGGIKRDIAVYMLETKGLGCFLVRENCTSPGEFVLSIRGSSAIEHIRVIRGRGGYGLGTSAPFESMLKLVDHFRHHSLHEMYDEIDTKLRSWPSKELLVNMIQKQTKFLNMFKN